MSRVSARTFSAFICLIVLLLMLLPAMAQGTAPTPVPASDDAVNAVSRNLYCPVCQNVPLEVCPTLACSRWREQVRELLTQGNTEEQVRKYFIDHFGMRTVGAPTDPFSQILTVGLPLGLIGIVGALVVIGVLRRKRTAPQTSGIGYTEEAVLPDDYRARLESELEEHR